MTVQSRMASSLSQRENLSNLSTMLLVSNFLTVSPAPQDHPLKTDLVNPLAPIDDKTAFLAQKNLSLERLNSSIKQAIKR